MVQTDDYGHLTDREILVRVATDQGHMKGQLEKQNGTLSTLKEDHYRVQGAVGFMKWIIAALIAAAGLVGGLYATSDDPPPAIAIQQVQCDPAGQNCEVLQP